ncbi:hypothetical protein Lpar_2589 [Legionella parisiensis]|uniref:Phasin domain-containing protein n=1 Tax=Legionella parisiensis TaxID=45071 RepID=A0A1E5JW37_9GAMM|nr:hypothetical protein [Legionella parisiensis]KTD41272.1 hypothetical protein Lpar_2589 [Legionella parisiensis]OEH48685.1 hypothetical protein lpari_00294 [Legionella parisiensis]STX76427.1 Uncharacterised protein [Legionella parisiensis]
MKNEFFEQKMFNNFETPIQKLMELNVKMMQNLSLMKPIDLLSLKKPEDIFERNMELFIQNSNMTLNYMRETFSILEHHWFNVPRNMDQYPKKAINEASAAMKKSIKKATATAKTTARKAVSAAKKASPAAKKASPAAKKASPAAKKASPAAKKASTQKNAKTAVPSKAAASKGKPEVKSAPAKPTMMHAKEPTNQNAPRPNMTADSGMPKAGTMPEKSGGIKDLGIQNMSKNNPMPNEFRK